MSAVLTALVALSLTAVPEAVSQSARQIPVAAEVDVVVVGGSTGAVSAAVAAARGGAKVFLVAPRPYLGDDMTATLRLWLEAGERPQSALAKAVFDDAGGRGGPHPNRIPFRYRTSVAAVKPHPDTDPPSLLTDGRWESASRDSAQYPGDVEVIADLQSRQPVGGVHMVAYQRAGTAAKGTPFRVSAVTIFASDDGQTWRRLAEITNDDRLKGDDSYVGEDVSLEATFNDAARYLKFAVTKDRQTERLLLGEIEILAPSSAGAGRSIASPRPMHVKRVLDEALLAAGVPFLYSCYPTDVLRDAEGKLAGVVVANRAGRQAIVAKAIIDATDRGSVARLAGAAFRPYPAGKQVFRRVVIGGEVRTAEGLTARVIDPPFHGQHPNRAGTASGAFKIIEYTLSLPMADGSWASFSRADQLFRTATYHPEQQFTSDVPFQVPPDAVHAEEPAAGAAAGTPVGLGAFRPKGVPGVWIAGGAADVPRDVAERLLRPLELIDLGDRIGAAAADFAKSVALGRPRVAVAARPAAVSANVGEFLAGVRPIDRPQTIESPAGVLPVIGRYDVLVVGGGTAGAPAGIAAARQGAKTLVVEYLSGLGGVGTLGAISNYCVGNRVGFTASVMADSPRRDKWVIEEKMEWWRSELLKAGGELWFSTIGCGAIHEGGKIIGAVVATPDGRGAILANVVVDATGNSDIAAAAGAKCVYTDASEFGMQGTGLPQRQLGDTYYNTDFTYTDETDLADVWHLFVFAKRKYRNGFDLGQLIDTRERRTIVGDYWMTVLDQITERTYGDTVVQARGGKLDTHGYTVEPYLTLWHPPTSRLIVNIPYRTMLPKGMEGVLVIGLGLSAHRDAVPLIRMQPDIQNGGYAAGVAAATAAKAGTMLRHIDVRALQRHLVEIGCLTPDVLDHDDRPATTASELTDAVARLPEDPKAAAVVFAAAKAAVPLLRSAFAAAEGKARLTYAATLGLLGDATGADVLLEYVEASPWDAGWNFKAMGQFGNALSPLDGMIVALGGTRDRRAVAVVAGKLGELTAASEFSHFRAAALALETLEDPAAAEALAKALAVPGIGGFHHDTVDRSTELEVLRPTSPDQSRRESLRELVLARALYRCGDREGLGRAILERYAKDLRGHLARHAAAVLAAGASAP